MRSITQSAQLLFSPARGWQNIAQDDSSVVSTLLSHTMPLALIPAVCWYLGVTQIGWQVAGETMRLTAASAAPMCILFYLAMVAGVVFLGLMVSWMASTYHSDSEASNPTAKFLTADAVQLVSYTATAFFVAGLLGLYPLLWFDLAVGTFVATWCIYTLYRGLPTMMRVPPEQGFLYASAVLAVALVAFVGLLTVTVLLWEFGPTPEYTY